MEIRAQPPGGKRQHHTVDERDVKELGELVVGIGVSGQVVGLVKYTGEEDCLAVGEGLLLRQFPKVNSFDRREGPDRLCQPYLENRVLCFSQAYHCLLLAALP